MSDGSRPSSEHWQVPHVRALCVFTARAWYIILEGKSTPSMRVTTEFFCDNGVLPIQDWVDANITFTCFTTFIITLPGDSHPIGRILLSLSHFLGCYRTELGLHKRHGRHYPLALIYRLNVEMMVFFASNLEYQGRNLFLSKLNSLQ